MATAEQLEEVRLNLGEPSGAESLFTDDLLNRWIDEEPSLDHAVLRGWKAKMAHFANLVNVTDGAASREFSDLLTNAERMVATYNRSTSGRLGRARIGRIVRPL